jgi:hypothetical protein
VGRNPEAALHVLETFGTDPNARARRPASSSQTMQDLIAIGVGILADLLADSS